MSGVLRRSGEQWHGLKDSDFRLRLQRPPCFHYTKPICCRFLSLCGATVGIVLFPVSQHSRPMPKSSASPMPVFPDRQLLEKARLELQAIGPAPHALVSASASRGLQPYWIDCWHMNARLSEPPKQFLWRCLIPPSSHGLAPAGGAYTPLPLTIFMFHHGLNAPDRCQLWNWCQL